MKRFLSLLLLSIVIFPAVRAQSSKTIHEQGATVATRIVPPQGYHRATLPDSTFAYYLRHFPLEPHGAKVFLYDRRVKSNQVHAAVLKADIGKRDLQQCADAVIRLRAEYLYARQQYDRLHFNFTNGFRVDYRKWAEGNRIKVNGNQAAWYKSTGSDYSYPVFRSWLDCVFTYAGTLSLSKELLPVPCASLQTGDVFIQGGSPGHAVIVMDVVENKEGKKLFLLSQSYMPAQSIHILKNPGQPGISPWYELNPTSVLHTPEWIFNPGDLKRFQ